MTSPTHELSIPPRSSLRTSNFTKALLPYASSFLHTPTYITTLLPSLSLPIPSPAKMKFLANVLTTTGSVLLAHAYLPLLSPCHPSSTYPS